MRKISSMVCLLIGMMFIIGSAGGVTNTTEKETETPSILPSVILNEEYNLFFDVEFPENYSIYAAEYEDEKEDFFYYLYLVTTDSAEEVVTFVSNLFGDSKEESIKQNLDYLKNDGFVEISGTQADTGLTAVCEISPTEQDADYEYEEGYVMCLGTVVTSENEEKYNDLLMSNFNDTPLIQVAEYIDITAYEMAGIRVNALQNNVQTHFGYYMSNAEQVWNDMAGDLAVSYSEEFCRFDFLYGELSTVILEDVSRGFIHVFQNCSTSDINIREYTAKISLKNLGFNDYREESAKCSYGDNEHWLSISKSEWGKNVHEGERNAITFFKNFNGNSLFVFYHPDTDLYSIMIIYDGSQIEYEYNPADDSYTDGIDGNDLSEEKEIAEQLFEKTDTDSILQDAWVTFELYMDETFGMNTHELFALSYE